jgi:YHS domain-containing protein
MKNIAIFIIIFTLSFSAFIFAEETVLKSQKVCPVLGGAIDKSVYVDYQGQRIYFCCPGCKETFGKDPEKFMNKIAESVVLLESVQKYCPVMTGHKLPCFTDKNIYSDYKGRRVYFCSRECKKSFLEEPEKYLEYLT